MNWIPLLPSTLAIILATTTKRVLPSLLVGLLCGSFLQAKAFLPGLETCVDYIVQNLTKENNLYVLLFLYLFSALVMLMNRSGGIAGFTHFIEKFIKGKRGVFYSMWALLPITFIDCGFRVVATGSILKAMGEKKSVSKERFALMLNNTASPIIELIPIATTFVAYNLGIIQQGLSAAKIKNITSYSLLLHSIPYQYFSLFIIPVTFALIFIHKKNDNEVEEKASDEGLNEKGNGENKIEIKPRLMNLVVPLLMVIVFTIGLIVIEGMNQIENEKSFSEIIRSLDPGKSMLMALFLSVLGSSIFYLFQGYQLKNLSNDFIEGGNNIMSTLAILILAWPLSKVSQDLGLGSLVHQTLGNTLPAYLIPVCAFLVTALITYFIGSSWGAMALVMPVIIPLAASGGGNLAIAVAAVISGGSYGDVTSPVSGMTNMAANILKANHSKYIKLALVYNSSVGVLAGILFFLIPFLKK